ncbi:MAG TPA: DUF4190 domain-containing protein [Gemmataceae bacterium]|nr:DUF4190 domain-containing protein [Gemmataceae bacterium]
MPLSLTCDCGARFEVDDALAGQTVSCPECQAALKAPAAHRPAVRTSNFALASFILAIVGAFTVVGSLAAAVLGLIGVGAILRDRERQAGLGFAVTGVVLGVAFTAVTIFGLLHLQDATRSMRGRVLAEQLDPSVDANKDLDIKQDGFVVTKPAGWGQAIKENPDLLTKLLLPGDESLLLIQPNLDAVIAVQVIDPAPSGDMDKYLLDGIKPGSNSAETGPSPTAKKEPALLKVQSCKTISSSDSSGPGDVKTHELIAEITLNAAPWPLPTNQWTMVIHTFQSRRKLFIVRGLAETQRYGDPERVGDKLLDVMKTFKPAPGS